MNTWCKGMELPDGDHTGCSCDCPACEARAKLLPRLKQSLDFIYKVVTKERERLGPAGLDGHLNAIGGTVLEMQDWIKEAHPPRALTPQEKAKGRSEGYWEMSAEDQWAEDKRLGILDWDGK